MTTRVRNPDMSVAAQQKWGAPSGRFTQRCKKCDATWMALWHMLKETEERAEEAERQIEKLKLLNGKLTQEVRDLLDAEKWRERRKLKILLAVSFLAGLF